MKLLSSYPKEVKIFLVASLVNSAGSSLMWPLITMFVFGHLGRSMTDAGIAILVQSLGGIFGQLIGGGLYYRIGVKKLIVGSIGLNALTLITLPFMTDYWFIFIIFMALIGFFNSMSMPAIQAFIGFRFADKRGSLFNVIYVANNLGVALGTALSGVLARISYDLSFIMNGLTSACFAAFFFIYLNRLEHREGSLHLEKKKSATAGISPLILLKDTRLYLFMGAGVLLGWLGNSVWNNGVSPHIISLGMLEWKYSILWTLNGVLIFAAQPITQWIKRTFAERATSQMTWSAIFYLLGYLFILTVHSYYGLIIAMVLATLGEMLVSPAIPEFISERTDQAAPFYLGLVGGLGSVGRVIGPFVMGVLYDHGGLYPVAWLAVAMAMLSFVSFFIHSVLHKSSYNV
ncbi:MFS transporter [Paenibacillus sediminis]|uniref:MFS family permease n=1 Tax=Paenibacillus sediminis TaxID=664909 RepID=A0ABS4H396_9BACL|nr:MFS transporter [Paenibacillus sediminis]MBP1936742.1 MFS family permease [Paenibacillus sediminis]